MSVVKMQLLSLLFASLHILTVSAAYIVDITAPSVVPADTPVTATINAEYHPTGTRDYAYALRIYLGTSARNLTDPGFEHSQCYLIHEQTLCDPTIAWRKNPWDYITFNNTPFTVTIPANVGPSGKHYVLMARVMNTDGSYYTGQMNSDVFELTGANGTWAKFQQQYSYLWGDDGIDCVGFKCVKDCADAPNMVTTNGTYQKCVNSCPNVSIDEHSSRGGDPTAPLVDATACPSPSSSSATPTVGTLTGGPATGSVSNTAAATAQSGLAPPRRHLNALPLACLPLAALSLFG